MLMGVSEEHCAKEHGQCAETGDAGGDVGFFVKSKAQFNEMQYAVAVQ